MSARGAGDLLRLPSCCMVAAPELRSRKFKVAGYSLLRWRAPSRVSHGRVRAACARILFVPCRGDPGGVRTAQERALTTRHVPIQTFLSRNSSYFSLFSVYY